MVAPSELVSTWISASGYPLRTPRIALVVIRVADSRYDNQQNSPGFLGLRFLCLGEFHWDQLGLEKSTRQNSIEPQMPHQLKRSRRMFSFILTFKEKLMSCDIFNYKRQIV